MNLSGINHDINHTAGASARTPAAIMRIRRYSGGSTRRGVAASPATTATKTLLVFVAAASGLGAVSAFGLGAATSLPLIGRAHSGSGIGTMRRTSQQTATTVAMTAKPSQVFVAGATGRLGQRVVR